MAGSEAPTGQALEIPVASFIFLAFPGRHRARRLEKEKKLSLKRDLKRDRMVEGQV